MEAFPVRLGTMTKAARGVLLSGGTHATAVRAATPALSEQTVDQAIGAIIGACLMQFVANWPAFEGPDKAEAVHQMRVENQRAKLSRFWGCVRTS
jgi:triphosphatase